MNIEGNAIEIRGVSKAFQTRHGVRWALRDLDLTVPKGSVYGLLGRNGAGKTTTLRALLGLTRVTSGRVTIFDAAVPTDLSLVIGRIGSMIDGPKLHPTLSATRNLEVLGRIHHVSAPRIGEVLSLVGLDDRAEDPLTSYSLGMRQRAGLAAALLADPDLLVLDEPTIGLDPAGVAELRDILQVLNRESGVTVLFSSHQLTEVATLCDRIAILHEGSVCVEGEIGTVVPPLGNATLESVFLEATR